MVLQVGRVECHHQMGPKAPRAACSPVTTAFSMSCTASSVRIQLPQRKVRRIGPSERPSRARDESPAHVGRLALSALAIVHRVIQFSTRSPSNLSKC